jgi:hypothetical protein
MRSRTKLSIARTHNRKYNSRIVFTSIGMRFPVPKMHALSTVLPATLYLKQEHLASARLLFWLVQQTTERRD